MALPQNAENIYTFLTNSGFSPDAAAGILGNIQAESGGNPEAMESNQSGGGGLIQWTPISSYPGLVTGNASADLTAQENAILSYVKSNGSIAAINQASPSPSAAALYFQDKYERPASDTASLGERQTTANAVASAATSGTWPAGNTANASGGSDSNPISSTASKAITDALSAFGITPSSIGDLLERGGLMVAGVSLVFVGVKVFTTGTLPTAPSTASGTAKIGKESKVADVAELAPEAVLA